MHGTTGANLLFSEALSSLWFEERHIIRGIPTLVRSTVVRGPSLVRSKSPVTTSSHFSAVPALEWNRNASTSILAVGRDDGGKVFHSGVADGSVSDSESECGDDGSMGVGGIAVFAGPPSYKCPQYE